jgi:hypothetical protein
MAPIIWSSWVADDTGAVDYKRVFSLVSVLCAFIGAVQLLYWMGGGMDDVPFDRIKFTTAILVTPLFVGRAAHGVSLGLARAKQRVVARSFHRGTKTDRRTPEEPKP